MKTLKRIALAGTLALAVVTIANVDTANAKKVENPFQEYGYCVVGCINKYAPETWGRTFCAADCYLHLVKDTMQFFNPFY